MEEPEKGLSTSGTSEPKVSHDEKVGSETLEGSVECRGQVQMEGSLSEELAGEGGACNGEDAMVGVMGSDVYIDGVSTQGTGAELNDEVGGGDSVEGGEDLGKDMKSAGIGSGTEDRFEESGTVESEEFRGENVAVELDGVVSEREVRDQAVVGSGECDVASVQDEALLDDKGQKEVGTGEARLDDRAQKEVETGEALLDDRGKKEVGTDEALLDDRAQKEGGAEEALLDDRAQKVDRVQKEVGPGEALLDDRAQKVDRVHKEVATVEKDAQVTDKGLMGDGKEKINDESNMKQNAEEQAGISELVGSNGGQEIEEEFNKAEKKKSKDRKAIKRALAKPGNSEVFHQARYSLPTEKEGVFSLSDMVWGKVRSHPWWPGQIFDTSDASERALKHRKKDCHLVAYFGDRTFAWNEASQLKPFRTHFSSIEKHSTSESFHNAVDCALDEVTRRVEYGLACSCIPKGAYDTIKYQAVENAGIRQELKFRLGVDKSLNASSFSPTNLVEYLKTLSELPTGGFDRLELVIAKAQLLAFYRFKGYSCLPELQHGGDLGSDMVNSFNDDDEKKSNEVIEHVTPVVKNDGQAGLGNLKNQSSSRPKRKCNLKDTMQPTKKERRLSDLMDRTPDSPDGDCWSDEKVTDNPVSPGQSKKRRAIDHFADDFGRQEGRKTISVAKVSNTTKSSFKIGDCIRRVASQLTGSPSMSKCSGDRPQKTDIDIDGVPGNGSDVSLPTVEEAQRSNTTVPTEYSSLDDLLSSLQLVALEPLGEYSFPNAIVSFFSDFRNSIIVAQDPGKEMLRMDKVGTKRKKPPIAGSPETFEFEDMNDTYWTDRVIDNGNEEQPGQQAEPVQPAQQAEPVQPARKNRKKDHQPVPAEPGKPVQVKRRYSKKQYSYSNHAEAPEKPPGYIDENAPAELVMNFAELDSVPSEASLNKMFRRFGPLKESETEVDRVSCRARVVFKKCVDAEVACSSAKKFNIFGSVPVNYQLNYTPSALTYTPSALFNASSVATTQDQEMHLDLSNFEVDMV